MARKWPMRPTIKKEATRRRLSIGNLLAGACAHILVLQEKQRLDFVRWTASYSCFAMAAEAVGVSTRR